MKKTAQEVIKEFFDALQSTEDDKLKPLKENFAKCLQVDSISNDLRMLNVTW